MRAISRRCATRAIVARRQGEGGVNLWKLAVERPPGKFSFMAAKIGSVFLEAVQP